MPPARSFNVAHFGSERRLKKDRPRETDPYKILETSSRRRNRFDPESQQSSSLLLKREGMKSVTFTNGQKVYRKSIITAKPARNRQLHPSSPVSPKFESKSVSQKEPSNPPNESPQKLADKKLSIIDTPKKAILVEMKEDRVSVNQMLTENEDAVDIHRDLESRMQHLKIKETMSVGGSEGASEGDSSIVMKSDLTEEPLSRSVSPMRRST